MNLVYCLSMCVCPHVYSIDRDCNAIAILVKIFDFRKKKIICSTEGTIEINQYGIPHIFFR